MKKNSFKRIALGVAVGLAVLVGVVCLLAHVLGDSPQYLIAGKPVIYWQEQLKDQHTGVSNQAFVAVNRLVIPKLLDTMFHDTNDSHLRLFLIETLNGLPGVLIYFTPAEGRRGLAAQTIGEFGAAAEPAIPSLIQAVKGPDLMVRESAIIALGNIHSDPEVVIPLLIGCLEDESVNDEAALALANYGSLARPAVPKILPLLHAPDKDAQEAARTALRKIDPEAYTNAVMGGPLASTNSAPAGVEKAR
jgi:hypothetical protein